MQPREIDELSDGQFSDYSLLSSTHEGANLPSLIFLTTIDDDEFPSSSDISVVSDLSMLPDANSDIISVTSGEENREILTTVTNSIIESIVEEFCEQYTLEEGMEMSRRGVNDVNTPVPNADGRIRNSSTPSSASVGRTPPTCLRSDTPSNPHISGQSTQNQQILDARDRLESHHDGLHFRPDVNVNPGSENLIGNVNEGTAENVLRAVAQQGSIIHREHVDIEVPDLIGISDPAEIQSSDGNSVTEMLKINNVIIIDDDIESSDAPPQNARGVSSGSIQVQPKSHASSHGDYEFERTGTFSSISSSLPNFAAQTSSIFSRTDSPSWTRENSRVLPQVEGDREQESLEDIIKREGDPPRNEYIRAIRYDEFTDRDGRKRMVPMYDIRSESSLSDGTPQNQWGNNDQALSMVERFEHMQEFETNMINTVERQMRRVEDRLEELYENHMIQMNERFNREIDPLIADLTEREEFLAQQLQSNEANAERQVPVRNHQSVQADLETVVDGATNDSRSDQDKSVEDFLESGRNMINPRMFGEIDHSASHPRRTDKRINTLRTIVEEEEIDNGNSTSLIINKSINLETTDDGISKSNAASPQRSNPQPVVSSSSTSAQPVDNSISGVFTPDELRIMNQNRRRRPRGGPSDDPDPPDDPDRPGGNGDGRRGCNGSGNGGDERRPNRRVLDGEPIDPDDPDDDPNHPESNLPKHQYDPQPPSMSTGNFTFLGNFTPQLPSLSVEVKGTNEGVVGCLKLKRLFEIRRDIRRFCEQTHFAPEGFTQTDEILLYVYAAAADMFATFSKSIGAQARSGITPQSYPGCKNVHFYTMQYLYKLRPLVWSKTPEKIKLLFSEDQWDKLNVFPTFNSNWIWISSIFGYRKTISSTTDYICYSTRTKR